MNTTKAKTGGKTALLLNGTEIISINGSKAGVTVCSSTNPPNCTNRYTVTQGANGTLAKLSGLSDVVKMDPTTNSTYQNYPTQDGVAIIRYSETKNPSTREFTPSGGCGGEAGQTAATLYPVLRDTVPSISIGIGGTPSRPATSTSFGSFPAAGGTTGGNCKSVGQTSGSDGEDAYAHPPHLHRPGCHHIHQNKMGALSGSEDGEQDEGGALLPSPDPVFLIL